MARIRKPAHGPEWYIQRDVIRFLTARGWNVEHTHGNLYQTGFPDLYVAHKKWGTRWIDCKQPKRYSFTRDQKRKWPVWEAYGIGIWILTAATQEEYDKLLGRPTGVTTQKPVGRFQHALILTRCSIELEREGPSA